MRLFISAAILALLAGSAHAAEIRVLSPGFVYNSALKDLAADFTKKTGVNVIVSEGGMNVIVGQIKTATPAADVIALPADLMNTLYLDGGIVAGSYTPLGRDELGLAVKKGASKPDISSVDKLAAVLKVSAAPGDAEAFLRYVTRPEAAAVWKAGGIVETPNKPR